jgi:alpha-galactosidase
MDDMSRPYDAHAAEIEAAHLAIDKTGRPMVLSLSPGETPVIRGKHVQRFAQMWRISDDFWDEWAMLDAQFTRLENWNPHMRPGAWPDADMLPLGRLALGARDTRFTPDEQQTLMSLWAITRSPLIMGGDLRHLDKATLALLTNKDIIAVNQASRDNRPHFELDGSRIWTAKAEGSEDIYLALFNTRDEAKEVPFTLDRVGLEKTSSVKDLWTGKSLGKAAGKFSATLPAHGSGLYRLKA